MIKKVIHICSDEKFIDGAIAQFARYKAIESSFFIIHHDREIRYVKSRDPNVFFFQSEKKLIETVNQSPSDCVVILHSIFVSIQHLLRIQRVVFICCWGWDIYSDVHDNLKKMLPVDLYKPYTRKVLNGQKKMSERVREMAKVCMGVYFVRNHMYQRLFDKFSAISTVFPVEFSMMNLPGKKFFPFRYMPSELLNDFTPKDSTCLSSVPRVLVGNSLDPTNNHIDVLERLERIGRPIEALIPISYGGNERYKAALKKYVLKFQNVKTIFLETFMDKKQYFSLVNTCCAAVFGHMRQQSAGNISHALKSGFDVYLYNDSLNYAYFRGLGYKLFSIEDDLCDFSGKPCLSIESQKENFDIYMSDADLCRYDEDMMKFFASFEL